MHRVRVRPAGVNAYVCLHNIAWVSARGSPGCFPRFYLPRSLYFCHTVLYAELCRLRYTQPVQQNMKLQCQRQVTLRMDLWRWRGCSCPCVAHSPCIVVLPGTRPLTTPPAQRSSTPLRGPLYPYFRESNTVHRAPTAQPA